MLLTKTTDPVFISFFDLMAWNCSTILFSSDFTSQKQALVWGQLLLQTLHEGHFTPLTTEPCKMDDKSKAHITNLSHVKVIFLFNYESPPAWHQHSENKKISQALWEQNFYI